VCALQQQRLLILRINKVEAKHFEFINKIVKKNVNESIFFLNFKNTPFMDPPKWCQNINY